VTIAPPKDPEAFKSATRAQWDACATGWNDKSRMIRDWLRDPTRAMLEMAGLKPGDRVLDVAAGAGDQTLDIAERVGPTGSVLATDLSPAILAFAQDNARRAGHAHVDVAVADAERLDLPDGRFDAAICRLGLMLLPDPLAGLREMARVLKPGGRACTLVFSTPERNPCVAILMATALAHAGLPPRDPYQPGGLLSLGKPGLIDALFQQAGFSRVATTTLAVPFRLPAVEPYLDFVRTSASPVLQILGRLDPAARTAAWTEIARKLNAFATSTGWDGPNELLLTVGER
jgi:SAM-dependent methyltransferase